MSTRPRGRSACSRKPSERAFPPGTRGSPTRAGPRTARPTPSTRTRTPTVAAPWRWSTTASSRTPARCAPRSGSAVTCADCDLATIERGRHAHIMLKEILEQPESPRNTLRGRLLEEDGTARLGGLNINDEQLLQVNRIVFTACGTSWHSALIGEYMMEELARIPSEVEYASEFRYRNPIVDERTLVVGISQSGETADTLAALREAKRRGARTLGLVNVVGSTIAREVDGGIYLHAGPEIGVASTKAFTSQIAALAVLTLKMGRLRALSILRGGRVIAVVTEGDAGVARLADHKIEVPETLDLLTPVLTVLPLQLLAYYVAVRRGCNVDQPRNLAKSVTVE